MKTNPIILAYSQIKEIITHGELPTDQIVSVANLSELLNMNRAQIIIACYKLETEKYIRIVPHQGIVIDPIPVTDIREIYETRQVVEMFAAVNAFSCIDSSDILSLEDSVRCQIEYCNHCDVYAFLKEYARFHQIIMKKHRNSILRDMYDTVLGRSMPLDAKIFSNPKHMQEIIDNHCRQIDCLKERNKQCFVDAVYAGQAILCRFVKFYFNENDAGVNDFI